MELRLKNITKLIYLNYIWDQFKGQYLYEKRKKTV